MGTGLKTCSCSLARSYSKIDIAYAVLYMLMYKKIHDISTRLKITVAVYERVYTCICVRLNPQNSHAYTQCIGQPSIPSYLCESKQTDTCFRLHLHFHESLFALNGSRLTGHAHSCHSGPIRRDIKTASIKAVKSVLFSFDTRYILPFTEQATLVSLESPVRHLIHYTAYSTVHVEKST